MKIDITELWDKPYLRIETPDGYQLIGSLVKKPEKRCIACLFDNNTLLEVSEDHLFQTVDGEFTSSKKLPIGTEVLHKNTSVELIDKYDIGIHDTYDLEVLHENHRYYTEGISSHNTGKSSTANALIKQIDGEALFINASMDNGIDLLRSKISNFASTESFDGKIKIVVLDECLEENEKVRIGTLENYKSISLNKLQKNKIYDCVSYNLETSKFENDTCEIISDKIDDIYEVTLEDGRTIKVTENHPFILSNNTSKSIKDGLTVKDDIVIC